MTTDPMPHRPEELARQRSARRAMRWAQWLTALVFLLMLALLTSGQFAGYLASEPFTVSYDPLWNDLNRWRGEIEAAHRWLGIPLVLAFLFAAVCLYRFGRIAGGGLRSVLRPVAVAAMLTGPVAALAMHATGHLAGPAEPTEVALHGEGSPAALAGTPAAGETYTVMGRDAARAELHEFHTRDGIMILLPGTLLLIAGMLVLSTPAARRAAGLEKRGKAGQ